MYDSTVWFGCIRSRRILQADRLMQRVSSGNMALPSKPPMLKVCGNAKAWVRCQADRLSAERSRRLNLVVRDTIGSKRPSVNLIFRLPTVRNGPAAAVARFSSLTSVQAAWAVRGVMFRTTKLSFRAERDKLERLVGALLEDDRCNVN